MKIIFEKEFEMSPPDEEELKKVQNSIKEKAYDHAKHNKGIKENEKSELKKLYYEDDTDLFLKKIEEIEIMDGDSNTNKYCIEYMHKNGKYLVKVSYAKLK